MNLAVTHAMLTMDVEVQFGVGRPWYNWFWRHAFVGVHKRSVGGNSRVIELQKQAVCNPKAAPERSPCLLGPLIGERSKQRKLYGFRLGCLHLPIKEDSFPDVRF